MFSSVIKSRSKGTQKYFTRGSKYYPRIGQNYTE